MYETKAERDALFNFTRKYTEVKLLNETATGFGWAVLVQDNLQDNELKVVKLPNREDATRELLIEAKILTKISRYLHHPNLIALGSVERYIIDWNGRKEDRYFVVLEYGGKDLRKRLGRLGVRKDGPKDEYVYVGGAPLPLDDVLRIGIQITDGLRALHDFEEAPGLHIVHRDIKPENILVDEQGTARLTDFGISKVVERLTQTVTVAGTLPYLAPEYVLGRITSSSDIYSLGIVLYEMATGRFPFRFVEDKFQQMPLAPHIINPEIPPGMSEAILRALWWDPSAGLRDGEAQRYAAAADLLKDLRRSLVRLYPVPKEYEPLHDQGVNVYRDKNANATCRILLYETKQPSQCVSRLSNAVRVDDSLVLSPWRGFESEEIVGVVAPPAQWSVATGLKTLTPTLGKTDVALQATVVQPPAGTVDEPTPPTPPELLKGKDVYPFLEQLLVLCGQLQQLHAAGIYHGWLCPQLMHWDGKAWRIDHVWLGPLVGLVNPDCIFTRCEELAGFLAPEVLRWQAPPTAASDVYGAAAILFHRVTGQPPLNPAAARALTRGEPAPLVQAASLLNELAANLSLRVRQILERALHTDPAQRQRSMEQLIEELRGCRWPDDMLYALLEQARSLQKQGRVAEVYDILDEAQRMAPGHEEVHHARATCYFLEGSYKWALKENAKALNVNPTPSVCFLHGQCLVKLERFEEALDCYREGLAKQDCSLGRHLAAQCLERMGQLQKALSECEIALRFAEQVEKDSERVEAISKDVALYRAQVTK